MGVYFVIKAAAFYPVTPSCSILTKMLRKEQQILGFFCLVLLSLREKEENCGIFVVFIVTVEEDLQQGAVSFRAIKIEALMSLRKTPIK